MSSNLAISARNLSKNYDVFSNPLQRLGHLLLGNKFVQSQQFTALKDVSFELMHGEALGIIGRNGAGKSTLLQIICGTLTPSEGEVNIKGRLAALLELGAGFNPEYTGRENVFTNGAIYGLSRNDILSLMPAILAFAEIGEYIDQPVKTYSSGMFMRLAFSVVAHLEPEIMIIDEALAVGDVYFTQKCMRFLRTFREEKTLLFVSHDTHSVINLCNKALWLDKGRVVAHGNAKEVCDAYLGSFFENRMNDELIIDSDIKEEPTHLGEFGLGGVQINSVSLLDSSEKNLVLHEAPQQVHLIIEFRSRENITQPILGFFVKDRLGQMIFGDNSIRFLDASRTIQQNNNYRAQFSFTMPALATGSYTIGVAIGAGTQQQHVQHHWIHDAIAFKAQSDPAMTGIIKLENISVALTSDRKLVA